MSTSHYESFWIEIQREDLAGGSSSVSGVLARGFLWLLVPFFQVASLTKRLIFALSDSFRTSLPVPVITVGNITVGGTGKTTLSRLIAELIYSKFNKVPVVLSRGYKSGNKRSILPVSRNGELLVAQENCGDEAMLLARWLPFGSVVLGKARAITGKWAVDELAPDYVLLDDGHQYWRLNRDFNIVTISAVQGFGNGYLFPRGPLREPLWGLSRADMVVLYQYSQASIEQINAIKNTIGRFRDDIPVIGVDIVTESLRPVVTQDSGLNGPLGHNRVTEALSGSDAQVKHSINNSVNEKKIEADSLRVLAFSGLGSPDSFHSTLCSCGAIVSEALVFPDHHRYRASDIEHIIKTATNSGVEAIVTTEKDEVNLQGIEIADLISQSPVKFYVLPVSGRFAEDSESIFLSYIKPILS